MKLSPVKAALKAKLPDPALVAVKHLETTVALIAVQMHQLEVRFNHLGSQIEGIDFAPIIKGVESAVARVPKPLPFPEQEPFPEIPVTDLSPVLERINEAMLAIQSSISRIKFPEVPTTDLSGIESRLDYLPTTDLSPVLHELEEIEEKLKQPKNWVFEIKRGPGGFIKKVVVSG